MRFSIASITIVVATTAIVASAFQAPLRVPIAHHAPHRQQQHHHQAQSSSRATPPFLAHHHQSSKFFTRASSALHAEAAANDGTTSTTSSSSGGTATIPNEIFNLVKSIVGAGVLSLPAGELLEGQIPCWLVS